MDLDELIEQLRRGEPQAGPFLISLLGPQLMAHARDLASDLSDTDREHICEFAVERAVRRIDAYDSERASFKAWVRGFVRYAVADWRRERGRTSSLDEAAELPAVEPGSAEPDHPGRDEAIAEGLTRLQDTDQEIIRLRDVERLPYGAIAIRLGVSEDGCRQRHLRALRRLRQIFDEDPGLQAQVWEE